MIQLSHIYKDYQLESAPVPVLKDLSLEVEQGDYLAIMGPSGSGKSTLMNIIGCLDTPTKGSYFFDGDDMLSLSDDAIAEIRAHKIGFVFQNFELLPGETAIRNVMLPMSFAGVRRSDRYAIARDALTKVGLAERLDHLPNQLSGGQKQRVAIARAMVNSPKLLLADEPTGALDQKSGAEIMKLFTGLNAEGVTIIMITHDAHIAEYAKHTLHIVDGEILEHKKDAAADSMGGERS